MRLVFREWLSHCFLKAIKKKQFVPRILRLEMYEPPTFLFKQISTMKNVRASDYNVKHTHVLYETVHDKGNGF